MAAQQALEPVVRLQREALERLVLESGGAVLGAERVVGELRGVEAEPRRERVRRPPRGPRRAPRTTSRAAARCRRSRATPAGSRRSSRRGTPCTSRSPGRAKSASVERVGRGEVVGDRQCRPGSGAGSSGRRRTRRARLTGSRRITSTRGLVSSSSIVAATARAAVEVARGRFEPHRPIAGVVEVRLVRGERLERPPVARREEVPRLLDGRRRDVGVRRQRHEQRRRARLVDAGDDRVGTWRALGHALNVRRSVFALGYRAGQEAGTAPASWPKGVESSQVGGVSRSVVGSSRGVSRGMWSSRLTVL